MAKIYKRYPMRCCKGEYIYYPKNYQVFIGMKKNGEPVTIMGSGPSIKSMVKKFIKMDKKSLVLKDYYYPLYMNGVEIGWIKKVIWDFGNYKNITKWVVGLWGNKGYRYNSEGKPECRLNVDINNLILSHIRKPKGKEAKNNE